MTVRTLQPRARMSAGALWLDSQGLNLIDLARLMDCSTGAVSHYLRGARRPPKNLFRAVQILLGESKAEELHTILGPATRRPPGRPFPPTRWLYDHGISPVELAGMLGASVGQISAWCRGSSRPPPEFLAAIEVKVGRPAVTEFEALLAVLTRPYQRRPYRRRFQNPIPMTETRPPDMT